MTLGMVTLTMLIEKRDRLLEETSWVDTYTSHNNILAWKRYRQRLKDFPQLTPIFPTPPLESQDRRSK